MANKEIFERGTIVGATKLPVITIGLGPINKIGTLRGIIWRNAEGQTVIRTKEKPEGMVYPDQTLTAVVRVIGDKVLMAGEYDIYVPARDKIQKLLSNPISLDSLPEIAQIPLRPLLNVASEVRPSLAPEETGRKVILIDEDVLAGHESITCHCSWDADGQYTILHLGDVFVVEDEEKMLGYSIKCDEFYGTHILVP